MRASGWDREEDNIVGGEKVRELRCPVVGGIVSIIYILKFLIIYKRVVLERKTVLAGASMCEGDDFKDDNLHRNGR